MSKFKKIAKTIYYVGAYVAGKAGVMCAGALTPEEAVVVREVANACGAQLRTVDQQLACLPFEPAGLDHRGLLGWWKLSVTDDVFDECSVAEFVFRLGEYRARTEAPSCTGKVAA